MKLTPDSFATLVNTAIVLGMLGWIFYRVQQKDTQGRDEAVDSLYDEISSEEKNSTGFF